MAEVKLPSEPTGRQIMALFARVQKGENILTDLTVDCSEVLDLSTAAMATLVRSLSDLQKAGIKVRLANPPQLLGHNCYRAGLLDGAPAVELVGVRQEEGSAS